MKVPCFLSFEFTNWRTAENDGDGNDEVVVNGDDDGNDDGDSVRDHGARFRHRRESGTAN